VTVRKHSAGRAHAAAIAALLTCGTRPSLLLCTGILQLQVDKGIALVDIVRELHP
jgi:hypothetical protein